MDRPDDLILKHKFNKKVKFRTKCGQVKGIALWKDWGYAETHYDIITLRKINETNNIILFEKMEMIKNDAGHFEIIAQISNSLNWLLEVEIYGFTFEIMAEDILNIGNKSELYFDQTDDVYRIIQGKYDEGDWVFLEIKNLSF